MHSQIARPFTRRQVPHSGAVLRQPPADRPLSAAAARFLPAERDSYDAYIQPDEPLRAACALIAAKAAAA